MSSSYQITTRIYQTTPGAYFSVGEKTVWNYANGGTWSQVNGAHVLTMGWSGTSGIMRFVSDSNEIFSVALGVHNYRTWTDIMPDLASNETAVVIHPGYYGTGTAGSAKREQQLSEYDVKNRSGRFLSVKCTVKDINGQNIACDIVIG